jgi:hypothetical protein
MCLIDYRVRVSPLGYQAHETCQIYADGSKFWEVRVFGPNQERIFAWAESYPRAWESVLRRIEETIGN